jgi:hypothetical protein
VTTATLEVSCNVASECPERPCARFADTWRVHHVYGVDCCCSFDAVRGQNALDRWEGLLTGIHHISCSRVRINLNTKQSESLLLTELLAMAIMTAAATARPPQPMLLPEPISMYRWFHPSRERPGALQASAFRRNHLYSQISQTNAVKHYLRLPCCGRMLPT